MIILLVNLIIAVALALINVRFVISFEVAFVGAIFVFYSSYRAVAKKISDYGAIMGADSHKNLGESSVDLNIDSRDLSESSNDLSDLNSPKDSINSSNLPNLPKKERFFIGFKVSFGLLRLASYTFIAISIIALINNGAFFLIPFLLGILSSALSSAFYVARKVREK